jgi:hypothetical protein
MKKILQFAKEFGIPVIMTLFPIGALAATFAPAPGGTVAPADVLNNQSDLPATLCAVVNWIFYGLIVFAIIMVLIAAYGYLTSSGDPEKTKNASHKLLYAAIAILVGLIARGFPELIGSFLGSSGSTATVLTVC